MFFPKSRHLQTYLSPSHDSPDQCSPSHESLEKLDAIHLGMEAEELAESWEDYYLIRACVTVIERTAKRRAKEGDPTLLLELREFQKSCPNIPPHQRICVSNLWG